MFRIKTRTFVHNVCVEVLAMNLPLTGNICVICECRKPVGIHLYKSFICDGCESDIIHTDTDNPKYLFFLEQLKKTHIPYMNQ
jgi:hypothetical protein